MKKVKLNKMIPTFTKSNTDNEIYKRSKRKSNVTPRSSQVQTDLILPAGRAPTCSKNEGRFSFLPRRNERLSVMTVTCPEAFQRDPKLSRHKPLVLCKRLTFDEINSYKRTSLPALPTGNKEIVVKNRLVDYNDLLNMGIDLASSNIFSPTLSSSSSCEWTANGSSKKRKKSSTSTNKPSSSKKASSSSASAAVSAKTKTTPSSSLSKSHDKSLVINHHHNEQTLLDAADDSSSIDDYQIVASNNLKIRLKKPKNQSEASNTSDAFANHDNVTTAFTILTDSSGDESDSEYSRSSFTSTTPSESTSSSVDFANFQNRKKSPRLSSTSSAKFKNDKPAKPTVKKTIVDLNNNEIIRQSSTSSSSISIKSKHKKDQSLLKKTLESSLKNNNNNQNQDELVNKQKKKRTNNLVLDSSESNSVCSNSPAGDQQFNEVTATAPATELKQKPEKPSTTTSQNAPAKPAATIEQSKQTPVELKKNNKIIETKPEPTKKTSSTTTTTNNAQPSTNSIFSFKIPRLNRPPSDDEDKNKQATVESSKTSTKTTNDTSTPSTNNKESSKNKVKPSTSTNNKTTSSDSKKRKAEDSTSNRDNDETTDSSQKAKKKHKTASSSLSMSPNNAHISVSILNKNLNMISDTTGSKQTSKTTNVSSVQKTSKSRVLTIAQINENRTKYTVSIGFKYSYFSLIHLMDEYLKRISKVACLDFNLLVKYLPKSSKSSHHHELSEALNVNGLNRDEQLKLCKLMSRSSGKINFFKLFGFDCLLRDVIERKDGRCRTTITTTNINTSKAIANSDKPNDKTTSCESNTINDEHLLSSMMSLTLSEGYIFFDRFKKRLTMPFKGVTTYRFGLFHSSSF